MNECRFEQAAHLYPFGMLTEREKIQFEAHMATCGSCAAIVKEARIIKNLSSIPAAPRPAPDFEQRILRAVKTKAAAEKTGFDWTSFYRFNKTLFPIAACLMILLLAAVILDQTLVRSKKMPVAFTLTAVSQSPQKTPSEYYMANKLTSAEKSMYSSDRDSALGGYYEKLSAK